MNVIHMLDGKFAFFNGSLKMEVRYLVTFPQKTGFVDFVNVYV